MELNDLTYNRRLVFFVSLIAAGIIIKLFLSAEQHDNWAGFFYSSLHVGVVGVGTLLALKK